MKTEIKNLIKKELESARSKFPRKQSSTHEGYAVLMEELDELDDEISLLNDYHLKLWGSIKRNHEADQLQSIKQLQKTILKLIEEAIQVGAMINRFEEDNLLNK